MIAGLTGILAVPLAGLSPLMGVAFLINGFVALFLGGAGKTSGAAAGALVLAAVNIIVSRYFGVAWKDYFVLVLALLIFAIRPQGIIAPIKRRPELKKIETAEVLCLSICPWATPKRKKMPCENVLINLLKYVPSLGGPLFLIATVAYGLQNLVNTELMILLYVYALLGLAIYVPMILTDQVSLAYAAYAGIGGYSVAILSSRSLEALWGVLLGMALAGLTAYLVALATRKLSGYFLAVGTLLVAVAFGRFLLQQTDLTGGADGLTFPREILGFPVSRTTSADRGGGDDLGHCRHYSKP